MPEDVAVRRISLDDLTRFPRLVSQIGALTSELATAMGTDEYAAVDHQRAARVVSRSDAATYIAFDGSVAVGLVTATFSAQFENDLGMILTLVVATSHRGRGIGTLLLEAAVGWLETENVHHVWLATDGSPQSPAVEFYLRNGFIQVPEVAALVRSPKDS